MRRAKQDFPNFGSGTLWLTLGVALLTVIAFQLAGATSVVIGLLYRALFIAGVALFIKDPRTRRGLRRARGASQPMPKKSLRRLVIIYLGMIAATLFVLYRF